MEVAELDYEARYLRRRMVDCVSGAQRLIDLPEARSLSDGEQIEAADGTPLTIRAAVEPLTEVRGSGLAKLAWHIGNRHTPCQVEADRLLIQRDHVLEDMLTLLGAEITHVEEPFQPEGGAYGHGRTHGHSHSHDPHTDPNAHIPHRHD
jgi:urease accessory protein